MERERTVLRLHPRSRPGEGRGAPAHRKERRHGREGARPLRGAPAAPSSPNTTTRARSAAAIAARTRSGPLCAHDRRPDLEDDTVTIRDRDSLAQERIPISGARAFVPDRLATEWTTPKPDLDAASLEHAVARLREPELRVEVVGVGSVQVPLGWWRAGLRRLRSGRARHRDRVLDAPRGRRHRRRGTTARARPSWHARSRPASPQQGRRRALRRRSERPGVSRVRPLRPVRPREVCVHASRSIRAGSSSSS